MLHNITEFYGYKLAALGGEIGQVKDFLFDDENWVIRYLVVDIGPSWNDRLVLLAPHALSKLDYFEKTLLVKLHKIQIDRSPSLEVGVPLSREFEIDFYNYYGLPPYWKGQGMWGADDYPGGLFTRPSPPPIQSGTRDMHRGPQHLKRARGITEYDVQGNDGTMGHVTGFLVDAKSWTIRDMTVETGHWHDGKEILIAPGNVERIGCGEGKVFVNLAKSDIEATEPGRGMEQMQPHEARYFTA